MVRTFQPHIREAKSVVGEELDIISSERDAFQRFLKRLDNIEAQAEQSHHPLIPSVDVSTVPSEGTNSTSDTVSKARNAYSETVMAVPHYSTEYDDSIYQSMAVEFGAPIVEYMNENDNPSDVILNKIMRESRTALSRRVRFISILHEEHDSLIQMESRINDVEERLMELKNGVDDYNRVCPSHLDTLQSRCDAIACDRQSLIHDRSISSLSGVDEESLLKYLYGEKDFRYPVLSEVVRCRRKIRKIRNARSN